MNLISILPAWWLGGERNGAVSPTTCLHNSFKCLPIPGQASLADPLQNLGLHFGKGQSPYCVSWLVYAITDKWPVLATVFNKSLNVVPNWDNSSLLSSRTSARPLGSYMRDGGGGGTHFKVCRNNVICSMHFECLYQVCSTSLTHFLALNPLSLDHTSQTS